MAQTTANQHPRDRLRGRIDRGVQAVVTACGLMVLMTLMLIFVYLLFAVLPLFMVRKLNRPLLGFLTMNCGRKEPHMVLAVAE